MTVSILTGTITVLSHMACHTVSAQASAGVTLTTGSVTVVTTHTTDLVMVGTTLTTDTVMAVTMTHTTVTVTATATRTAAMEATEAMAAIRTTTAVITRLIKMRAQVNMCHAGEVTVPPPGDHIQQRVMAESNQAYPLRAVTQEGPGQYHLQQHLHKPELAQQPGDRQLHLRKAHIPGLHQFRTAG